MDRNPAFPRALRYLLAIAETGSFTRAAEVLYVSQPSLSQQIKQLEDLLGVQLLDRSGRATRLTPAGEVYVYHARRALRELELARRAVQELDDLSRGSLRIGMTPITDVLAVSLLEQFSRRFPAINVSVTEMPQRDIVSALGADEIDLGIAFSSALSAHSTTDEVDSVMLFVEQLVLAVAAHHPISAHGGPVPKHVLEEYPLVMFSTDYELRRQVDQYCMDYGVSPQARMEVTSLSVILELVRLGHLVTVLPRTLVCAQHGSQPISLLPELPRHTICLLCRKDGYKSPACRAFGALALTWATERCPLGSNSAPCPAGSNCSS